MRHLFVVLLIGVLVSSVWAVPASSSFGATTPSLERSQYLSQNTQVVNPVRPWTRFRDWVIERIWGLPEVTAWQSSPRRKSASRNRSPPANVRARYGTDVVIRFQLRSQEEARALAEAADILFLDLWASTPTFVDIRLAEEVVSQSHRTMPVLWARLAVARSADNHFVDSVSIGLVA